MLIGLVGKPSAGKSTFFKAATLSEVEIASYPFTTIKANRGVGYVKIDCLDKEFGVDCNPAHGFCLNHNRFVPVELMDVAGLVPGASEGKGLGNQFLNDLRLADAFIHIVDMSGETDSEGKSVESHNPLKDMEFLDKELDNWYFNFLLKAWKIFVKRINTSDENFSEAVSKQFSGLKVTEENVKQALRELTLPAKPISWKGDDLKKFSSLLRRLSKPTIIAANKMDLPNAEKNYKRVKKKFPKTFTVPCSADSELALRKASKSGVIDYIPGEKTFEIRESVELSGEQKKGLDKIRENVLEKFEFGTGVQEVLNKSVFELLDHVAVFPASANKLGDSKGNILPDCFLLPKGSTALDFAFYLHTDFGKNFIKAIDARTKRALGKNYELKNRDALEIVTK
jgi:ribosome-binding ATPase YchF (GTP1/OBG family)